MKNKKGQGLSINTLVIIALAVFVIFLVIGFVTSGWSFFTSKFQVAKVTGEDVAKSKCDTWCASWQSAGRPDVGTSGYWYDRLCAERFDVDINGDGVYGTTSGNPTDSTTAKDSSDGYSCRGTGAHPYILTSEECPLSC